MLMRPVAIGFNLLVAVTPLFGAAAQYYNADAGHPFRIEDALAVPTRAVSVDAANIRIEQFARRGIRYRYEPALEWGVMPRSEIGLRLPFVIVPSRDSTTKSVRALAGVALSGMRVLTVERPGVPATALASELLLPVGGLSANKASFALKAIISKRVGTVRIHLNSGGGSYALPSNLALATNCIDSIAGTSACTNPPIIIDLPCLRAPANSAGVRASTASASQATNAVRVTASMLCGGGQSTAVAQAAPTPKLSGARWFSGVGIDHAFALASTALGAEYTVEKFEGLYKGADQTTAIGFRSQTSPTTVLNGSFSWHFAGAVRSFAVTAGITREFALPFFHRSSSR